MTTLTDSSAHGLTWSKSSYSDGGNNCVEVAAGQLAGVMPVRDSKVSSGPAVIIADSSWGVFVDAVKGGQL
ncbi:DUF397 domain-containing protein [Streptomyces sp. H27-H1]|uniref:DUF397 domain-containing protein n=1 Tax=Streptomyces sp. H27-H1 TaxID=2996461 RepID=UPI002271C87F|nr:DUF397 domain-containing protein [Streptomyces sp. H27-H1]MCY0926281.1 DUF397 domain-containing protein [Streptomyces sp. H27-H1]